jgi:hypothetical protein
MRTRNVCYGRCGALRRMKCSGGRGGRWGDWRSIYARARSLLRLFRRVRLGGRKMSAYQLGMIQINRTGMGLLFGNPDFGEIVQHRFGFYLQLAGQFVDAYLNWVRHL